MSPAAVAARYNALPAALRGGLAMLGSGLAFAVMMVAVRHLTTEMHPFQAAFFRNLFGFLFLLPWLLGIGRSGLRTRKPWLHLARAVCGMSAMMCLFTAISLLPLAEATAITFTAPLFATAGAALLLGETVRLRRWVATLIGFAGMLIILRPGAGVLSEGAPVALAAAAFMAGAILFIKRLSRTEHPTTIVFYFGLLLTPLSLPPALFVWTPVHADAWPWLLLMGLAATVGQLLLTRAFATADASVVLPFDFMRLIFVSVMAYLAFHEVPDTWTWVGAAVILSATAYIAHRERGEGAVTPPAET